jgi:hypothetical protein
MVLDRVAEMYEAQLAAKDAALADREALVAELRRRAEAAEAERDALRFERVAENDELGGEAHDLRWLAAPAAPHEVATPATATDTPAPPVAAQGFWQRLRRAFGGE